MSNRAQRILERVAQSMTTLQAFRTLEEVGAAAARQVSQASADAIASRGRFVVAFSGGSLPATLCPHLLHLGTIDFSKWWVVFADERCVPHSDPESNFGLLQKHFLSRLPVPIPVEQVIALNENAIGENPEAAAVAYERDLVAAFGHDFRIDVVLLGMGPDGHVASLFPGHRLLDCRDRRVASISDRYG